MSIPDDKSRESLELLVDVLDQRGDARRHLLISSLDNPGWRIEVGLAFPPVGPWKVTPSKEGIESYWRSSELSLGVATALRLADLEAAPSEILDLLARWFIGQCDGDWEHSFGLSLEWTGERWKFEIQSDGELEDSVCQQLETLGFELLSDRSRWASEWSVRQAFQRDELANLSAAMRILIDQES